MTDYYVKNGDRLLGPYSTYTVALDVAALLVRPRVLLDIGSVDVCSERQMRELLAHDPLLHAMFRLGVEYALRGQAR